MAFPYSFAVVDNISTAIAYSRGPCAVAELIVEQINTLKHVFNINFVEDGDGARAERRR